MCGFNAIYSIITSTTTIDTISQSKAGNAPPAITILTHIITILWFEMMLHKKEEICMTKKDFFIISEPNSDLNVETTPNMLSRDGADIIDKNSSLPVKCNSLSHIFINVESI